MRYNNYIIYSHVKKISLIKFLNKRIQQVGLIPNQRYAELRFSFSHSPLKKLSYKILIHFVSVLKGLKSLFGTLRTHVGYKKGI